MLVRFECPVARLGKIAAFVVCHGHDCAYFVEPVVNGCCLATKVVGGVRVPNGCRQVSVARRNWWRWRRIGRRRVRRRGCNVELIESCREHWQTLSQIGVILQHDTSDCGKVGELLNWLRLRHSSSVVCSKQVLLQGQVAKTIQVLSGSGCLVPDLLQVFVVAPAHVGLQHRRRPLNRTNSGVFASVCVNRDQRSCCFHLRRQAPLPEELIGCIKGTPLRQNVDLQKQNRS